jgi:plasmid maintenance system antidote protein VapI
MVCERGSEVVAAGVVRIAFNTSAESWMNQQVQYDLWHAERARKSLRVSQLQAA